MHWENKQDLRFVDSPDEALYTNLNKTLASVDATSVEMKNLLADLKANPKKYLKVSVF